jgi:hypothetical protein
MAWAWLAQCARILRGMSLIMIEHNALHRAGVRQKEKKKKGFWVLDNLSTIRDSPSVCDSYIIRPTQCCNRHPSIEKLHPPDESKLHQYALPLPAPQHTYQHPLLQPCPPASPPCSRPDSPKHKPFPATIPTTSFPSLQISPTLTRTPSLQPLLMTHLRREEAEGMMGSGEDVWERRVWWIHGWWASRMEGFGGG